MALYEHVVPKPKDECTKGEQLGVSFAAGYIAGVFCAVVSHPADNLVSAATGETYVGSHMPWEEYNMAHVLKVADKQSWISYATCVVGSRRRGVD